MTHQWRTGVLCCPVSRQSVCQMSLKSWTPVTLLTIRPSFSYSSVWWATRFLFAWSSRDTGFSLVAGDTKFHCTTEPALQTRVNGGSRRRTVRLVHVVQLKPPQHIKHESLDEMSSILKNVNAVGKVVRQNRCCTIHTGSDKDKFPK